MANWLLFSGGLATAFCSQLAKISHCSNARVPGRQGSTTLADRRNTKNDNRFSILVSYFLEAFLGSRKWISYYPLVTQDSRHLYLRLSLSSLFSIFFPLNLSYLTTFSRSISLLPLCYYYLGSRLLLNIFWPYFFTFNHYYYYLL